MLSPSSLPKEKLLLFDFGAILVSLDKQRAINAFKSVGAEEIAVYIDEHRSEDLFHRIELGGSAENFCREVAEKCPNYQGNGAVWAWEQLLTGIPVEKLRLIHHLKHDCGYKTAVLSNTNWIHWNQATRDFFTADGLTVGDYFDHIFLSCGLGVVKPDPSIYQAVLDETGVKAEDILFIDDSIVNCKGAEALGIHTMHDPSGNLWMKRITGESHREPSIAIIGNFDGVHLGHQYIINKAEKLGKKHNLRSIAVTFNVHPRTLFDPSFKPQYLSTTEEKVSRLKSFGLDEVSVIPFTKEFANTSAHDFMKLTLKEELNVEMLLIGYDNRFGKRNSEECFEDYQQYGKELGIKVVLANPLDVAIGSRGSRDTSHTMDTSLTSTPSHTSATSHYSSLTSLTGATVRVSSSHIRHLVGEGRMEEAAVCLGSPYSITGTVAHGYQEGRKIGFPTANIMPPDMKLLPPNGAYETTVIIDGKEHLSMTSIGTRPTYGKGDSVMIETNIFDFNEDIYDKEITVLFKRKLRNEQQFNSVKELMMQLQKDKRIITQA